jgi:outer membrane protein
MRIKFLHFALCILPFSSALADSDCSSRKTVPAGELTLQRVVELGLCRNPLTAAAYLSAESARLSKNAGYASYLPQVSASASIGKDWRDREWGEKSYGASLSASWLIFDFGKRLADLNQLAATWRATGFDYDEAVQSHVYGVIGAYYGLLTADADVKSAESLLKTAQTAKDTADKKFKAGSVARADVLKADTTLASRQLESERARNNREIAKGRLLQLLSFSQTQDIQIADMPPGVGGKAEDKTIEELIAQAEKTRPELLRAIANKDAAWHRRNARFLQNLPSITVSGSLSWNDADNAVYAPGHDKTSGSIGIRASMPIFAGFANIYGVRAAEVNYEAAKERERAAIDAAELDIFTAYNNYKTSRTVVVQAESLLKSAAENEKVTAGMYKVGRANMLEWQTAQSELVNAERQNNAAKYDLFIKRAALALSIGDIKSELDEN